jgi:phage-related minor tail protein
VADKQAVLSIVLRTVDRATAGINAINKRIDAATKPIRDFRKALGDLREKSGLNEIGAGFRGVGNALTGILGKVAMIGGAVGIAVAGVFSLVNEFDDLGDKAEAIGVGVDFLAQMRHAAVLAGASVEQLDGGLQGFVKSLGQARAGTGRMAAFLGKVSPVLLQQLKATKSNAEAVDLLADAMAKLEDPAKKAALAQATVGDAALAPLLAKGGKGVKALRDEYAKANPDVVKAAEAAAQVADAQARLKAATDGVKSALVTGLAPALKTIVDRLSKFFTENRERIAEWAKDLGEKLPAAFDTLVDGIKGAIGFLTPFFNSTTKIKIAIGALIAVMVGPLISAVVSLGIALAANPIGLILTAIAALAVAWFVVITRWDEVKAYFTKFWDYLGDKFGVFRDIIAAVMAPFIYIPLKIISNWEVISKFFTDLWDGVTGVFQRAWNIIKDIVDKVSGAVSTVTGAIGDAVDFINPFSDDAPTTDRSLSITNVAEQARAALQTGRQSTEARVTVDFANAPRGMRVSTDPQSTGVDTSVGYQMIPGF